MYGRRREREGEWKRNREREGVGRQEVLKIGRETEWEC